MQSSLFEEDDGTEAKYRASGAGVYLLLPEKYVERVLKICLSVSNLFCLIVSPQLHIHQW